jgi:S-adenosylmethionine decarboxylase
VSYQKKNYIERKMPRMYTPGLHIIADFKEVNGEPLTDLTGFKLLLHQLLAQHQLQLIGEVHHRFEGGGYTSNLCLTESHISMHTWPEYGIATFDVFLSNYQFDNNAKTKSIYESVKNWLKTEHINYHEIYR